MKHFLIIIVLSVFPQCIAYASDLEATFSYSISDFSIGYDSEGQMTIEPITGYAIYPPDSLQPMLPLFIARVYIPRGYSLDSFSYSCPQRHIYFRNVTMAPSPAALADYTDGLQARIANYETALFPDEVITYRGTDNWDGYNMAAFLVSPFEYNSANGCVYFNAQLDVTIELVADTASYSCYYPDKSRAQVQEMVVNKDEVELHSLLKASAKEGYEEIEYAVITSETLSDAFEHLAEWKRIKGIPSQIITIENIEAAYTDTTVTRKIQHCLQDMYEKNGLRYALLGGDASVVPAKYCYSDFQNEFIPSDMYYSCFYGHSEWDRNGNGICGETDDGVNNYPFIYVTRLPLKDPVSVQNAIAKIISYEKGEFPNGYQHRMLTAGCDLARRTDLGDNPSDAELQGDLFYEEFVSPYWDGQRVRLYDTCTDIEGIDPACRYTPDNIHAALSDGYSFIQIISHGAQTALESQLDQVYYYAAKAASIENAGFTIMTSPACDTNAFDVYPSESNRYIHDYCFGGMLLGSSSSGIVAFLGNARAGIVSKRVATHRISMKYEDTFYSILFGGNNGTGFGEVSALAKRALRPSVIGYDSSHVHFSLTPVGDPEMPIFTAEPHTFEEISVSGIDTDEFTITSGTDDCRFSLFQSSFDSSLNSRCDNANQFNVPSRLLEGSKICITKQGYIPQVFEYRTKIQNENMSKNIDIISNSVRIGSSVDSTSDEGAVMVSGQLTTITANEVIIEDSLTIPLGSQVIISNKFSK